jgi:hypothetical protein
MPISNLISGEGSFDVLKGKGFQYLPDALLYCGSSELILVLPVPRNHPENVACQIGVIKDLTTFVDFAAFEE